MGDSPQLVARMTVEKMVNRYAAATRAVLEDWGPGEGDEAALVNALHKYADSPVLGIAQEAVNAMYRAGREDGLSEVATEVPPGQEITWRRSSVMEESTCDSCAEADGEEIDGPDDDLTDIHEGPPETCLCIPYADLEEGKS